jgi:predicted peroxiredoxin
LGKILAVSTHGTDDPTKVTLAFITAIGAMGAEKECSIALLGEAAAVAREAVAKTIHGVGFPPLPELIEQVVKNKTTVYV